MVFHTGLIYIYIFIFDMIGKRYFVLCILFFSFFMGCCPEKYYTIGNAPEYNICKMKTDISTPIFYEMSSLVRVTTYNIYKIDSVIHKNDDFKQLIPFVTKIYNHNQPKRNHKFVDDIEIQKLNDSIVLFHFNNATHTFPKSFSLIYHIKKNAFLYKSYIMQDKY